MIDISFQTDRHGVVKYNDPAVEAEHQEFLALSPLEQDRSVDATVLDFLAAYPEASGLLDPVLDNRAGAEVRERLAPVFRQAERLVLPS